MLSDWCKSPEKKNQLFLLLGVSRECRNRFGGKAGMIQNREDRSRGDLLYSIKNYLPQVTTQVRNPLATD